MWLPLRFARHAPFPPEELQLLRKAGKEVQDVRQCDAVEPPSPVRPAIGDTMSTKTLTSQDWTRLHKKFQCASCGTFAAHEDGHYKSGEFKCSACNARFTAVTTRPVRWIGGPYISANYRCGRCKESMGSSDYCFRCVSRGDEPIQELASQNVHCTVDAGGRNQFGVSLDMLETKANPTCGCGTFTRFLKCRHAEIAGPILAEYVRWHDALPDTEGD